jgi:LysR family transcriptional regulator for metE and metH
MIERIHLAILRQIKRSGTLTGAADALCLTQSALSHAIKKLEQQFNTPLWTKEGRSLRLTQAGDYMLRLAERMLPQFEHAEEIIKQYAKGQKGLLRIGMECHPCYTWLLRVVSPFLHKWPDVDLDLKQQFQFGGINALSGYEIDVLITPDPLNIEGLRFTPVFDYELMLAVSSGDRLSEREYVKPEHLADRMLITYPVAIERLDIFTGFLLPANCRPGRHKVMENTEIMLQMVGAGRGVTALPDWLLKEYAEELSISSVRIGAKGIHKQIFVGVRRDDADIDYLKGFIKLAEGKHYNKV